MGLKLEYFRVKYLNLRVLLVQTFKLQEKEEKCSVFTCSVLLALPSFPTTHTYTEEGLKVQFFL